VNDLGLRKTIEQDKQLCRTFTFEKCQRFGLPFEISWLAPWMNSTVVVGLVIAMSMKLSPFFMQSQTTGKTSVAFRGLRFTHFFDSALSTQARMTCTFSNSAFNRFLNSAIRYDQAYTFDCLQVRQDVTGARLEFDGCLTVEMSSFQLCQSVASGGAICFTAPGDSALSLIQSTFTECSSESQGGGVYAESRSSLDIASNCFSACRAKIGGAVCIICRASSTGFTITDTGFFSCNASDHGGALFASYTGEFRTERSRFRDCHAVSAGGCISLVSIGDCTVVFIHTNFTDCTGTRGSAIYLENIDSTFDRSYFQYRQPQETSVIFVNATKEISASVPLLAFDGPVGPLLVKANGPFRYTRTGSTGDSGHVYMNVQDGYDADDAFDPKLPLANLTVRLDKVGDLTSQLAVDLDSLCAWELPSVPPESAVPTTSNTSAIEEDNPVAVPPAGGGLSIAIIVLIVVACLILLALIILAICLVRGGLGACCGGDDKSGKNVTYF
jgi:hypothetical protein